MLDLVPVPLLGLLQAGDQLAEPSHLLGLHNSRYEISRVAFPISRFSRVAFLVSRYIRVRSIGTAD